jgi:hypothetical protein
MKSADISVKKKKEGISNRQNYQAIRKVVRIVSCASSSISVLRLDKRNVSRQYSLHVALELSVLWRQEHVTNKTITQPLQRSYILLCTIILSFHNMFRPSSGECYTLHYVCGSLLCTDYIYIKMCKGKI